MIRKKFNVGGMTCSSCSAHVEHDVQKLEGIQQVDVSLMTGTMVVEFDEAITSNQQIIEAVQNGGYTASIYNRSKKLNETNDKEEKKKRNVLIASIILLIVLMYFSMGSMLGLPLPRIFHDYAYLNGLIQLLLLIPILVMNRHYFINGTKRLFKMSPNMDSLIALGSIASLGYGLFAWIMVILGVIYQRHDWIENYHMELYFESSAMIVVFVSLGKFIEKKSKGRATKAIGELLDLTPKTATLIQGNTEVEIEVEDIQIGDIVLVKPGTLIPIDGKVVEGMSAVDESSLTGESVPVTKEIGSLVKSGTTNLNGVMKIEASCESFDTTLQKIIDLVDVASNSKASTARLADKVSLFFVPIVMAIALVTFVIWIIVKQDFEFSLARAISVLVISCPCALGLATPVAIMVGTYKAVRYGILIKSGESLENLCAVNTVVFDKTGTLTRGLPVVTDVIPVSASKQELMQIAATLEKNSEHPLSHSIVEYAKQEKVNLLEVVEFENCIGQGVKGKIEDIEYFCGQASFLNQPYQQEPYEALLSEGKTVVFVFSKEKILGMIALRDELKPTSVQTVEALKALHIDVVMLTGDQKKVADVIASDAHIDHVISQVMPEEKASVIETLHTEGKKIAMVGDGINDSVALMKADIGIAMGSGTDVAIDCAEVVLMKDDLTDIPTAIALSKKVIRTIKMNLFWAFFYNACFIPIAAGALYYVNGLVLSPMLCAIAMSLSSVCVVLNALRINMFRKESI